MQRSRVTNGSQVLPGVDGRSAQARRFRDIINALTADLGGDLTVAEQLQVRTAAALQMHVEDLAARGALGEVVSSEQITRAGNGALRAMEALKRRRRARAPRGPAVQEYLAKRAQA